MKSGNNPIFYLWRYGLTLILFLACWQCQPQSIHAADQLPQCGPEQWFATYNGAAQLEDRAIDLVVDQAQNVIVTGWSVGNNATQTEWVTFKYDNTGNRLWQYLYHGTGDANGIHRDQGSGVTVDGAGNIYVTGSSLTTTQRDIVTIKLSPVGEVVWVQTYNGQATEPTYQEDFAYNVIIAHEQVYVFGQSANQGYFAVLIYTLDGQLVRELTMAAQATKAFTVDTTGNIFLAGLAWNPNVGVVPTLNQYDANGNLRWSRTIQSTTYQYKKPLALQLDPTGNLYMLTEGERQTQEGHSETLRLLMKYKPSGDLLWERAYLYNEPADADALISDESGNIYTIGRPDGSAADQNILAVKHSPNGGLLTSFRATVSEKVTPINLTVAPDGGVMIVGGSNNIRAGNDAYLTLTTSYFTSDGNVIWVARHPARYMERPAPLMTIDSQHFFVAGASMQEDMLLLHYAAFASANNDLLVNDAVIADGDSTPPGNTPPAVYVTIALTAPAIDNIRIEYHTIDGTALADVDYTAQEGIAYISKGQHSVQVAIPLRGNETKDATPKAFYLQLDCVTQAAVVDAQAQITIFDDDADLRLWSRTLGDGNSITIEPMQAKVDAEDNLYIAANYHDPSFTGDVLLKYNTDGALVWQRLLPGGYVPDMRVDNNAIYVTTQLLDKNSDVLTHKLTLDGILLWTHRYDSSTLNNDVPNRLTLDGKGGVTVSGTTNKFILDDGDLIPINSDLFVVAIDANGQTRWVYTYDSPEHRNDEAGGIGLDPLGNRYVVGISSLQPAAPRIFWLRLAPDGVQQQFRTYELPNNQARNIRWANFSVQGGVTVAGDGAPFGYVLRLLPNGTLSWWQYLFGSSQLFSFATNRYDESFVTTSQQMIKYANNGQLVWNRETVGAYTFPHNRLVVADNGLIYGTVSQTNLTQQQEESVGAVLDPSGKRLWQQVIHEGGRGGGSRVEIAAPLASQGVYFTGAAHHAANSGYYLVLERFQPPALPPLLTLNNASVREASTETTDALVLVTLSSPVDQEVQVPFTLLSASATGNRDFASPGGLLLIPAGQQGGQIRIPILADTETEPGEFFFIQLGRVTNAFLARSTASVLIIDVNAKQLFLPFIAAQ